MVLGAPGTPSVVLGIGPIPSCPHPAHCLTTPSTLWFLDLEDIGHLPTILENSSGHVCFMLEFSVRVKGQGHCRDSLEFSAFLPTQGLSPELCPLEATSAHSHTA